MGESDLQSGRGNWENIQDVIRSEFMSLRQLIKEQRKEMASLHQRVAQLESDLKKKAEKRAVEEKMKDHTSVILENMASIKRIAESKADAVYVEDCFLQRCVKSDMERFGQDLCNKWTKVVV